MDNAKLIRQKRYTSQEGELPVCQVGGTGAKTKKSSRLTINLKRQIVNLGRIGFQLELPDRYSI